MDFCTVVNCVHTSNCMESIENYTLDFLDIIVKKSRNVSYIVHQSKLFLILQFSYQLLKKQQFSTLRQLYYRFSFLFTSQIQSDTLLKIITWNLKIPREHLGFICSCKSIIKGDLILSTGILILISSK